MVWFQVLVVVTTNIIVWRRAAGNSLLTVGVTNCFHLHSRRPGHWGSMFIWVVCRLRLKCDGTRAETRLRLSPKRTSPFKSAGASVQSTTGSPGVRISGSNAGYTTFRGSVKSTGYTLHLPVSPSLPLPCVTVCHHISTGLYICWTDNFALKLPAITV